jgi:fibronectin type 3 domain-containing protein
LKRALRLPLAILVILFIGIVGTVLFQVGADGKPPSISLKWNPPAPKRGSTITGYNVYRTQPDRTFQSIASVTEPAYVDRAVRSGETYDYFVVSVDADGHESRPSNYVSVTVP